jgi:hypothetical protein
LELIPAPQIVCCRLRPFLSFPQQVDNPQREPYPAAEKSFAMMV